MPKPPHTTYPVIKTKHSWYYDLTNCRFGKLVALRLDGFRNKSLWWECVCDCGNRTTVRAAGLQSGHSKSCGCGRASAQYKHGKCSSPTYHVWHSMIQRCTNPNHHTFQDYGGRGISVCKQWLVFTSFLTDMGERPSVQHSIDRIDNAGNYEPKNCKWSTRREQGRNKRNNVWITAKGKTLILADWARATGIERRIISGRLQLGWSDEDAVLTPVVHRNRG